jgi:chromosome segregation ATPase
MRQAVSNLADMIVPMLQRLQTDVSELKTDVRRIDGRLNRLEERFEAMGPYLTYHMGLYTQNQVDIERHDQELSLVRARLDKLEAAKDGAPTGG